MAGLFLCKDQDVKCKNVEGLRANPIRNPCGLGHFLGEKVVTGPFYCKNQNVNSKNTL
jgi:hypothetical protein